MQSWLKALENHRWYEIIKWEIYYVYLRLWQAKEEILTILGFLLRFRTICIGLMDVVIILLVVIHSK